jgi:AraC-like DNA-binding protein
MEPEIFLSHYHNVTSVPCALLSEGRVASVVYPASSISALMPKLYNMLSARGEDVDIMTTKDSMHVGFVRNKLSGDVIVVGPVMEFLCSLFIARSILAEIDEPIAMADDLLAFFKATAPVSFHALAKNLSFLYYAFNGEEPPSNFAGNAEHYSSAKIINNIGEAGNVQDYQKNIHLKIKLLAYIKFGKMEDLQALLQNREQFPIETFLAGISPVGSIKNIFATSVSQFLQAAIEGGLDSPTSISLADQYLKKADSFSDLKKIRELWYQMVFDYTGRVKKIRELSVSSTLVHKAASYILSHLYEKISANSVADQLGYNRSYISNCFAKTAGKKISDYITEMKIEEAKLLLQSTKVSLADISSSLWFSSQSHFHRVFKKVVGETPAQYRNANQKNFPVESLYEPSGIKQRRQS